MRCQFCGGSGSIYCRESILGNALNATLPCPECGGTGHLHCCEGLREQPEKDCASSRRRIAKMNIDDAARATRKYSVVPPILGNEYWRVIQHSDPTYTEVCFNSPYDSQDACDRMNLRAVLEAIREPSVEMYRAGVDAALGSLPEKTFRAMIDALIAEVGE